MPTNIDDAAAGAKHDPSLAHDPNFQHESSVTGVRTPPKHGGKDATGYYDAETGEFPTEEELHSLRRVPGHVPWKAFALAFVELCERFSYYGTTVVCKSEIHCFRELIADSYQSPTSSNNPCQRALVRELAEMANLVL
jgi:hypothetical protein